MAKNLEKTCKNKSDWVTKFPIVSHIFFRSICLVLLVSLSLPNRTNFLNVNSFCFCSFIPWLWIIKNSKYNLSWFLIGFPKITFTLASRSLNSAGICLDVPILSPSWISKQNQFRFPNRFPPMAHQVASTVEICLVVPILWYTWIPKHNVHWILFAFTNRIWPMICQFLIAFSKYLDIPTLSSNWISETIMNWFRFGNSRSFQSWKILTDPNSK